MEFPPTVLGKLGEELDDALALSASVSCFLDMLDPSDGSPTMESIDEGLRADVEAILGPQWLRSRMDDRFEFFIGPLQLWEVDIYPGKVVTNVLQRCDVAFDAFTRATDLRCDPPDELRLRSMPSPFGYYNVVVRFSKETLSLKKVFVLIHERFTKAATQARDRIAAGTTTTTGDFVDRIEAESLTTGGSVKAATVATVRDAVDVVIRHGDDGEVIRLLKEVKGDDRVARGKLVGTFAAIALRAQLGDRLVTIFDGLSLPFLDESFAQLESSHTPFGSNKQRYLSMRLQTTSMLLLAIAAMEDHLPPLVALISNFDLACRIAAQWRAQATSDDVHCDRTSYMSPPRTMTSPRRACPKQHSSPETKFEPPRAVEESPASS